MSIEDKVCKSSTSFLLGYWVVWLTFIKSVQVRRTTQCQSIKYIQLVGYNLCYEILTSACYSCEQGISSRECCVSALCTGWSACGLCHSWDSCTPFKATCTVWSPPCVLTRTACSSPPVSHTVNLFTSSMYSQRPKPRLNLGAIWIQNILR